MVDLLCLHTLYILCGKVSINIKDLVLRLDKDSIKSPNLINMLYLP